MGLLKKYRKKNAIPCPKCKNELNWYSSSQLADTFKCNSCDLFYENKTKKIKSLNLIETDKPRKMEEYHRQRGMLDETYNGIPTSLFYEPRWIRIWESIFKS